MTTPVSNPSQRDLANAIRALSMDAVEAANSGHPGMPMGMADVAAVLFTKFLKFDASAPKWPDRDRFVLSAGHGSMLLYSLLYLTGSPDVTIEEVKKFRQLHSKTPGHPEYGHTQGVETTTGPLGQGISTAVGMAIAERLLGARFGDKVVDHHTYAIVGDGCLMEGISHEAIDLAGHLKLNKLIVLWDDNSISIDGSTSLSTSTDQVKRFEAAGWNAVRVDGHNAAEVEAAIAKAKTSDKPTLIACKTIIGFGAPNKQGSEKTHGAPLGKDEIAAAREFLGWPYAPFEVPEPILSTWRAAGTRGKAEHAAWHERLSQLTADERAHFERMIEGELPASVKEALDAFIAKNVAEKPKLATRKSSEMALQVINDATDMTIGGSADLTHSNYTITRGMKSITPDDFTGRYLHYGIREHIMGAAMNGIALHGGFVPYGGTFLVFSDYLRGSIRLSALMGLRVLYVLTHDSIGVGEDGPTHQPIEHLASLRALPNVNVFRPADIVETAEAYEIALASKHTPSVLALSRQNLPTVRTEASSENLTAKGAYVLRGDAKAPRDVTLIATGSEIELAVSAAEQLNAEGVKTVVVSMPCFELFEAQPEAYRAEVLGTAPRIAIEAAGRFGWDRWIGDKGAFVGMNGFGASGPAPQVYKEFGITVEAVIAAAKKLVA
ncbi:transketolase [Rhodomicrobium vannielii ATCC 17100]|uniref:Transketolase n=1 Tax=Rhodomicrobium vannielii (strain ATCC 17100 / DSM 162 / LMG 4299 / NCIMB 10020 / ATH 3.1.1) TaxID=648757 RepID=E3I483_RHOVT|nr:transketolase [Rhodomicrobium vannielii]ADP69302.1 transketolase [Rhodomicrobium vannielii ATCC 17100]